MHNFETVNSNEMRFNFDRVYTRAKPVYSVSSKKYVQINTFSPDKRVFNALDTHFLMRLQTRSEAKNFHMGSPMSIVMSLIRCSCRIKTSENKLEHITKYRNNYFRFVSRSYLYR